ncbi:tetratricopeptide repeat protein [bacterium]|nr:tetratricopeptide repeat protein [bacterium]
MHRVNRCTIYSIAVLAAALCAPLGTSGAALAADSDDVTRAHVSEAVQTLFAADQERLDATQRALDQQDVIRQEISVCIDPRAGWLSGESRLWIESPRDHVLLLLDDSLRVLTVHDARGDTLLHTRVGDVLEVFAPASAPTFPLEIKLSYEGQLAPADGAMVSDDVVVLGPGFHWYPVSDARDPARLRVEVRYPRGYSSVVSGTLAGMAPSLAGAETCTDGDVWDVPTPVTRAGVVVGRLESSLTVVGDVFFGNHTLSVDGAAGSGAAGWQGSPSSVPSELIELLRFLETCFGAYPYEWLNVVRLPADPGRPAAVVVGPGLVVVQSGGQPGSPLDMPLSKVVSGLSHSWWSFWIDPGQFVSAGLATQAEAGWLDATGDEDGADRLRGLRRAQYMRAVRDSGRGVPLLDCLGPGASSDGRICGGKGSAVFEILKSVVGQGAYCAALRSVASEHGGESVGLSEFVEAFEEEYGHDLDWFFYEWVSRSDLPAYAIEYEATPVGDGTYIVRGLIRQEGEPFRTPLPITIDLGGWAYDETIAIESSHQSFEIRTDAEPIHVTIDRRHLIPKVNRAQLAGLHLALGAEATASGDWDAAVDEFGAAVALEPDNASFARAYALALVRHGRLADGLRAMDRAIALDPTDTDVRFEAAGLHLRSGDFATAVTHLDVYVGAKPSDPTGHIQRARALAELGRLDEAQSSIDLARELVAGDGSGPDLDEDILLATGRLYEAQGDTAAAVRAYEAALAANPVSDEARGRLRALNLPEAE